MLEDTAGTGNIIVYNKSFEITRLMELQELFPQLAVEINQRIVRIKDLMIPFAKRHYYHPLMKGRHSIKKVLPLLVPELSYDQLPINNGSIAMNKYEILNKLSPKERDEVTIALEEYCYTDVLAMAKILKALQQLTGN